MVANLNFLLVASNVYSNSIQTKNLLAHIILILKHFLYVEINISGLDKIIFYYKDS